MRVSSTSSRKHIGTDHLSADEDMAGRRYEEAQAPMKEIILLHSSKGIEECVAFARAHSLIPVSLTPESDEWLASHSLAHKGIGDYGIRKIKYDDLYMKRLRLWRSWGEAEVAGRPLNKHLTVDGIDLWESVENEAGEVNLEIILVYCDVILQILRQEKPVAVLTQSSNPLYLIPRERQFFPDLIRQICRHLCIKIKFLGKVPGASMLQKPLEIAIRAAMLARGVQRKLEPGMKGRKDILFFAYGSGLDKIVALHRELKHCGVSSAAILGGGLFEKGGSYMRSTGSEFAYIDSLVTADDRVRAREDLHSIRALWKAFPKDATRYRGIDLYPVFGHQLAHLFHVRIPECALLARTLSRMYSDMHPSLVVTLNDAPFFGRIAVQAAKRHRIKTLLIQHANRIDPATRNYPLSDHVATWYEEKGARYVRTGTPKYSGLRESVARHSKKEVYDELRLPDKPLVLFAARFPVSRDLQRMKDAAAAATLAGAILIVKLHPAETHLAARGITQAMGPRGVRVLRDYDFVKLLSASDVVISTDECTTSTDAVMVEKPLILVDYEQGFGIPFERYPRSELPCIRADSPQSLKIAIHNLLNDTKKNRLVVEKARGYNERVHASLDGLKSTAELIVKLARQARCPEPSHASSGAKEKRKGSGHSISRTRPGCRKAIR
jgi:hypothetical protein